MRLIPRSTPLPPPPAASKASGVPNAYVSIDRARCIGCAAGASHAPELFEVSARGTRVKRQPESPEEVRQAETAALLCPVQAIDVHPTGAA
ncbi:MAG TPA: ferredoxin [Polyangiaceae bacterium]|nr:ferredoxin [Polyangiaceae bacterium]